jgi:poly(A) polymerase Pap1
LASGAEEYLAAEFLQAQQCGSGLEKRSIVQQLEKTLKKWVLGRSMVDTTECGDGGSVILAGGSYSLGLEDQLDDSDVDLVCLVPNWVAAEAFFDIFPSVLLGADGQAIGVEELSVITTASVPRITCRCKGIKFDLLLSRAAVTTVPAVVSLAQEYLLPARTRTQCAGVDGAPTTERKGCRKGRAIHCLFNGRLTAGMDDWSVRALGGPIVSALFRQLVPNFENFRRTLWFVRRWARSRCIYSNKTGFLGGVGWAILVCFVCQCYPTATPTTLIRMFFHLYSEWQWSAMPVLLTSAQALHAETFRHPVMAVVTPAWPASNAASHVSRATLAVLQRELMRGWALMQVAGANNLPTTQLMNSSPKISTQNPEVENRSQAQEQATILTWGTICSAVQSPDERKSMVGEFVYGLVEKRFPTLAGKITGMLLQMDLQELCRLTSEEGLLEPALQLCCVALQDAGIVVEDAKTRQPQQAGGEILEGEQAATAASTPLQGGPFAQILDKSHLMQRYQYFVRVDVVERQRTAGGSSDCVQSKKTSKKQLKNNNRAKRWASKQQLFVEFVASRLNKLVLALDALPGVALVHPVDQPCQDTGAESQMGMKELSREVGRHVTGGTCDASTMQQMRNIKGGSFWLGVETAEFCEEEELTRMIKPVLAYFLATETAQPQPRRSCVDATQVVSVTQHVEAAVWSAPMTGMMPMAAGEYCAAMGLYHDAAALHQQQQWEEQGPGWWHRPEQQQQQHWQQSRQVSLSELQPRQCKKLWKKSKKNKMAAQENGRGALLPSMRVRAAGRAA